MRAIDIQELDALMEGSAFGRKAHESRASTSSAEWRRWRRVAGSTSNVLRQVVVMYSKRFWRSLFIGAMSRSYNRSCTQLNVFLRTLRRSTITRSEMSSLGLDISTRVSNKETVFINTPAIEPVPSTNNFSNSSKSASQKDGS